MLLQRAHFHVLNGIAATAVLTVAVAVSLADTPLQAELLDESGPIESLSAVGYLVCAILLLCFQRDRACCKGAAFVLIALGLREMDFHNLLTTESITRTRFYLSPDVPVLEKSIGGGFLVALAVVFVHLIGTRFPGYLRALRRGEPAAVGVAVGLSFMGIAKALDGLSRKLAGIGLKATINTVEIASVWEETLELGIPVMFLAGIVAHQATGLRTISGARPVGTT
ncbi:MAG: hypothetical protein WD069_12755 [Planctomycetales bacterium]